MNQKLSLKKGVIIAAMLLMVAPFLSQKADAKIVFQNDDFDTVFSDGLLLDFDDEATGDIIIQFGATLAESIRWSSANSRFEVSDDLRVEGNAAVVGQGFIADDHAAANSTGVLNLGRNSSNWESLQWNTGTLRFDLSDDLNVSGGIEVAGNIDFNLNQALEARVENLASAPTCNAGATGQVYQNTTDGNTYACDGTSFQILNNLNNTHYHNGSLANDIITATVTGVNTTGENTTIFLTDDGTSGGNLLFSSVYHVSAAAEEIQTLLEAPAMHGYSYNAGTGALTIKFLESNNAIIAVLQGLEAEESGTPFTVFVVGI